MFLQKMNQLFVLLALFFNLAFGIFAPVKPPDNFDLFSCQKDDNAVSVQLQPLSVERNQIDLALKTIREIAQKNPKASVIYSPFSTSMMLALLYPATCGKSTVELGRFLGGESAVSTDVRAYFERAMSNLRAKPQVNAAMFVFIQRKLKVKQAYINYIDKKYPESLNGIPIPNDMEKSKKLINNLIANKTKNQIPDLLEKIDPNTQLILASALYFEAEWQMKFSPLSAKSKFFYERGKFKNIPFMYQKEILEFYKDEDLRYVRVPYVNGFYAEFILPKKPNGLDELLPKLNVSYLMKCREGKKNLTTTVILPKFKFASRHDLKPVLEKLGLSSIFNQYETDLNNILKSGSPQLVVSDVVQKATIEMVEWGTRAAAANAATSINYSGGSESFYATHPFLFLIVSQTDSLILFNGVVRMERDEMIVDN